MIPIKINFGSYVAVAAKIAVTDQMGQILAEYKRGKKGGFLPPRACNFLLTNLKALDNDELVTALRNTIKATGLSDKWQMEYIKKYGEEAIDTLPDVCEEAQEYCLRRELNVPALIDKIPDMAKACNALLKAAINTDTTPEPVIRFILYQYLNEITGLNLRKAALLKFPNLVFILPSSVDLTLTEKKELIQLEPSTFKAFTRREPSLVKLYNQITKGDGEEGQQHAEDPESDLEGADATKLQDLINQLNDARLSGDDTVVAKLTKRIAQVRKTLDTALNLEPPKKEAAVKTDEKPKTGSKVAVTRNDLTGFVLTDPTSGVKYTVLSHMSFTDVGDLPEAVSTKLSPYLKTLDFEPNQYLRLRKAGTKTTDPITHLLLTAEQLKSVKVVEKVGNESLDGMISAERVANWSKVNVVMDGEFTNVQAANVPKDEATKAPEGTPPSDPNTPVPSSPAKAPNTTHQGIADLHSFVKQLVSLKNTVDKKTLKPVDPLATN